MKTVVTLDDTPSGTSVGNAFAGTQTSDAGGGGDNPTGSVLGGGRTSGGTVAATSAFIIGLKLSSSLGFRRIGGLTLKLHTSIARTRRPLVIARVDIH